MTVYVLIVKNRHGSETVLAVEIGSYGLLQTAAQALEPDTLVWFDVLGNEENLVAGGGGMKNYHIVSYTSLE